MLLNRKYLADFDWVLLGLALAVALFGVIEISSVQPTPGLYRKQLINIGIGVTIAFVVTFVDYRTIVQAAPILYAFGLVLLALVLSPMGRVVNGNKAWLYFGSFGLQPSEFAKLFTILLLTYFLGQVRKRPLDLRTLVIAGAIWIVPVVLVFLQNDTGSTLSFLSIFAALIFLSGVRWSWVAAGLAAMLIVGVIAVPRIKEMKGYKAERIKAVYWPELASKRYRYQNEQSEIAVGSGGIIGKGIHSGTQGSLGFVPEVHTDFIFAVASEETGFVGSLSALTIYLLMITRLLQIARQARDRTGLLLVAGFAALLLYHVTVSVGMVVRLLPVMGIPLPLMSYGGTSVLATFVGIGLALNVRLRRFVN
ncbi:MAG: FtsW/RodA/SpoVE family cell cycle protein [Acidobacteriota bacterium]